MELSIAVQRGFLRQMHRAAFTTRERYGKITILQKYLGVRSHNAAVKRRGMVAVRWSKPTGYTVTPTRKNARFRNAFNHIEGKTNFTPVAFRRGDLAAAFLTAMQLAPIEALENPPMSGFKT